MGQQDKASQTHTLNRFDMFHSMERLKHTLTLDHI